MFGRRVKKIKDHNDFDATMSQLVVELKAYCETGGNAPPHDVIKYACLSYTIGEIDEGKFEQLLSPYMDADELNEYRFRYGLIDALEYERTKIEASEKKSIAKITTDTIDPFLNGMESVVENIQRNALKKINDLNLRFNNISYIDYEIENANLNDEPYIKVFFTPSDKQSSELEIDIRYNDNFVESLKEREGFHHTHDDDGELIVEDLIEQWFHTAIIVLAANMLKESDIDFFRSISSDEPGAELINKLEFDRESIPEEHRDRVEEFMKYKGIYR